MSFKEYNEIENSYRTKFLEKIKNAGFTDPEKYTYACFTKVDGSNFSLILDQNDNFYFASRTNILSENNNFNGCIIKNLKISKNKNFENKDILFEIKKYVKEKLFKEDDPRFDDVKKITNSNFYIQLYGELCGGMYKHPDVPSIKNAKKIQGRVSYHPDIVWICFDGFISSSSNDEEEDSSLKIHFNVDELKDICLNFDIPYQVEKFRGSFDECLKYPNTFNDDTGHILFGLPLIENNITEGVVIKPINPIWLDDGSRVMLKNKNDKFKERGKNKNSNKIITETSLNENELKILSIMNEYITESRFMSVISKNPITSDKEFGKILGLFTKDLINDVLKENEDIALKINSSDEINFKQITKIIQKEIVTFIKPLFFNL